MSRSNRAAMLMATIAGLTAGIGGRFDPMPADNRKRIDDPPLPYYERVKFKPQNQKFIRRKSETRKTQHRSGKK